MASIKILADTQVALHYYLHLLLHNLNNGQLTLRLAVHFSHLICLHHRLKRQVRMSARLHAHQYF